jgi:hypothetical protein
MTKRHEVEQQNIREVFTALACAYRPASQYSRL